MKIVFVEIDFLINNSSIGKATLKNLDDQDKKNVSLLKSREQKLRIEENEIKKKQNILSEEELNKEIEIFKNKISKLKNEQKNLVKNFTNLKNEEIGKIIIKINETLKSYMKKNSIDLVFDKKNIYIGKNSLDITQNILQELERN